MVGKKLAILFEFSSCLVRTASRRTIFSCFSLDKICISLSEVIGKPSFSFVNLILFTAL